MSERIRKDMSNAFRDSLILINPIFVSVKDIITFFVEMRVKNVFRLLTDMSDKFRKEAKNSCFWLIMINSQLLSRKK